MNAIVFLAVVLDWDLGSFLNNTINAIKNWGGLVIMIIGLVMVIVGVFKLAKGLMSQNRGQTNWVSIILLFIFGGALFAGGLPFVLNIAEGGKKTIEDLGSGGTIIPWYLHQMMLR